jgi:hypothetical protein
MNTAVCVLVLVASTIVVFGNDNEYEEYDDDDIITALNTSTNSTLVFTRPMENVTADPGAKLVKLVCEVQNLDPNNTKVTFTWRKNNAPVDKNKHVNVKTLKVRPPARSSHLFKRESRSRRTTSSVRS